MHTVLLNAWCIGKPHYCSFLYAHDSDSFVFEWKLFILQQLAVNLWTAWQRAFSPADFSTLALFLLKWRAQKRGAPNLLNFTMTRISHVGMSIFRTSRLMQRLIHQNRNSRAASNGTWRRKHLRVNAFPYFGHHAHSSPQLYLITTINRV